jgi:hypothetical protein
MHTLIAQVCLDRRGRTAAGATMGMPCCCGLHAGCVVLSSWIAVQHVESCKVAIREQRSVAAQYSECMGPSDVASDESALTACVPRCALHCCCALSGEVVGLNRAAGNEGLRATLGGQVAKGTAEATQLLTLHPCLLFADVSHFVDHGHARCMIAAAVP